MKALPTLSAMVLVGACLTSQASPICQYYDLWQSVQSYGHWQLPQLQPKIKFHLDLTLPEVAEIPADETPIFVPSPIFELAPNPISLSTQPAAVPEPSSLFAMALGLVGLGAITWRRRRPT